MAGDLVEPNLEELGVLELEYLGLVSKAQGDPVGDSDQLSTSFERDSSRKRVPPFYRNGFGATTGYRHRVLREAIDRFPTRQVRIVYDRDQRPRRITFLHGEVQGARSHLPFFDNEGGQPIGKPIFGNDVRGNFEFFRIRHIDDVAFRLDLLLEIVGDIVAIVYLLHPVLRAYLRCLMNRDAELMGRRDLRYHQNRELDPKTSGAGGRRRHPCQRS